AIEQRLHEVVQRFRSLAELDIKKEISFDVTGKVQLRFRGEELKRIAVVKRLIDEYVRGFIATSDKKLVWHESFGTTMGLTYLEDLAQQHGIYIRVDMTRNRLALFGEWQQRHSCLLDLVQKIEEERQWQQIWRHTLLDWNQLSNTMTTTRTFKALAILLRYAPYACARSRTLTSPIATTSIAGHALWNNAVLLWMATFHCNATDWTVPVPSI
ncbi:MAG: hypothetical protein Q9187_009309, partial [Circinaria calcarea]